MIELLWIPAVYAYVSVGALIAGRGGLRRGVVVVMALAAPVLPWLPDPGQPFLRVIVAIGAVWMGTILLMELAFMRPPLRPSQRVWHAVAIFDTLRAKPVAAHFDRRNAAAIVFYGALGAAALWVVMVPGRALTGPAHHAVRWLGGAVFAYAVLDTGAALVMTGYRLAGIDPPLLHDRPIVSRSVQEFWGRRWNLIVGGWLSRRIFRPLVRRGHRALGLVAAFFVSALIHWYLAFVGVGWGPSLVMGGFFVLQVIFIALEGWLRVAAWPTPLQHAWAVSTIGGSSPMFSDPLLRAMDPMFGG